MKTLILFTLFLIIRSMSFTQTYTMPHENEPHEGTWLQWPHQYEYGMAYRNSLDATWVAMTTALVAGEKVHIIAYNNTEKNRIINLLTTASVPLTNVDFFVFQTNDVWVRDNGPIFVIDSGGNLKIEDWGFNGWGGKYNYNLCNPIPTSIGNAISTPVVNLNSIMTNEGGAIELDGNGVLLACKSSIISQSPANSVRNPGMTQAQAEIVFSQYLGVTKFIWLDGNVGDPNDVTDFHIDGFAKFVDDSVIVTMNNTDLTYWGVSSTDISTLYNASNINNVTYQKVYVPLTQNNVVTTTSLNLGYKGSYVNYYVANGVVLVPNYNDPNDQVANAVIQGLYPGRTVIGIDVRNLYENGGMVHCVTQQQPLATTSTGLIESDLEQNYSLTFFPNPFSVQTIFKTGAVMKNATLIVENCFGQTVAEIQNINGQTVEFNRDNLATGLYFARLIQENKTLATKKLIITDK
jgi:agmatine deiminase